MGPKTNKNHFHHSKKKKKKAMSFDLAKHWKFDLISNF